MLSMSKERSYNSVVASVGKKEKRHNDFNDKLGRNDRGNINVATTSDKAWASDNTMYMK